MQCSNICLTGYHGTTTDFAKSILEERHFNVSNRDNEWAGHGIYFFIDGYTLSSARENAFRYARDIKCFPTGDVAVLRTDIDIDSTKILDLTKPEHQAEFLKIREFLWKEAYKRFGDEGTKKIRDYRKYVLECSAINTLCSNMGYIAVIKSEYINFEWTRNGSHPKSSIPNSTMFCLRLEDCIVGIHLVDIGDLYV